MLTKMCSNEQHLHKQSLDSGLFALPAAYILTISTPFLLH